MQKMKPTLDQTQALKNQRSVTYQNIVQTTVAIQHVSQPFQRIIQPISWLKMSRTLP